MSYSTGSASSASDLINKLSAFAVTNGWTLNLLGDDGTGRRLHLSKNGAFINLRSFINETLANVNNSNTFFNNFYGISMYGSDGYDASKAWQFQPGRPAYGNSALNNTLVGSVNNLAVAIPNYHFFSYTDTDDIYCVIEFQSGRFQMFGWGQLAKYNSATFGGFWFSAPTYYPDYNQAYQGNPMNGQGYNFQSPGASEQIPFRGGELSGNSAYAVVSSYLRMNANGHNGWAASGGAATNNQVNWPPVSAVGHAYYDSTTLLGTVSPYTWQTQMLPQIVYIAQTDATKAKPFGEIKNMRRLNVSNYAPAEEFALGPDTWKVFPYFEKTGWSGLHGYAIRKVS